MMEVIDVDSYEIAGFQRRRPTPPRTQSTPMSPRTQSKSRQPSRLKKPDTHVVAVVDLCASDDEDKKATENTTNTDDNNGNAANDGPLNNPNEMNVNYLLSLPMESLEMKKERIEMQLKSEELDDLSEGDISFGDDNKQPALNEYEDVSDDEISFGETNKKSPIAAKNAVQQQNESVKSRDSIGSAHSPKSNEKLKNIPPNQTPRSLAAAEGVGRATANSTPRSHTPNRSSSSPNKSVHSPNRIHQIKMMLHQTPSNENKSQQSFKPHQTLRSLTSNGWIRPPNSNTTPQSSTPKRSPIATHNSNKMNKSPSKLPQSNGIRQYFTPNHSAQSASLHGAAASANAIKTPTHSSKPNQPRRSLVADKMAGQCTTQSSASHRVHMPPNQSSNSNNVTKSPTEKPVSPFSPSTDVIGRNSTSNDMRSQLFTPNVDRFADQAQPIREKAPQTPESGIANSDVSSDFEMDIYESFVRDSIPESASLSSAKTVWSSKAQIPKQDAQKIENNTASNGPHFNVNNANDANQVIITTATVSNNQQTQTEPHSYTMDHVDIVKKAIMNLVGETNSPVNTLHFNQTKCKRRASNDAASNGESNSSTSKRQRTQSSESYVGDESDDDDDDDKSDPPFQPDQEDEEEDIQDDCADNYDSDASDASKETLPFDKNEYHKSRLKPCKTEMHDESSCDSDETVMDYHVHEPQPSK